MNTVKLALALSTLLAASALIACSSASGEDVGSSEQHATADIDHMFKRADGSFDVWCADGTQQVATAADLKSDNVCNGGASSSSSGGASSSGSTSGNTSSSSSSGNTGPTECIGTTVPPKADWKAPAQSQNVCTPADLQKLSDTAQTATSWQDIVTAVTTQNAACGACIFTPVEGANWGPIVMLNGGQDAFINWSACFARAPGSSDACGESFFQQNQCGAEMCQSCSDDASAQNCYGEAVSDATKCGQYDVETACNGFATVNAACPDVFASIGFNCGGK
jgi:hypothetical protein